MAQMSSTIGRCRVESRLALLVSEGIMEKKMETTMIDRANIGVI